MEQHFSSLRNHFLIAMPSLSEGIFAHSVTYLCEHSEQGAMGIVINRPAGIALGEILEQLEINGPSLDQNHAKLSHADDPVMVGGPVQTDRGFVLHRHDDRRWEATLPISDEISLTTSVDILDALAHDRGPHASLVALGYAGWDAGQLEEEIAANSWLTIPADSSIIFDTPIEQRLDAAAAKLGIDLTLMAPGAGHA